MKQKLRGLHFKLGIGLLTIALCIFSVTSSQATIIWDPTGLGAGGGGGGTWDTGTTAAWFDSTLGLPDILWPSGGDADFLNAGGTVNVGTGGVTVNNMTFNSTSNYTVLTTTANSITMTGKITVSSPQVNFGSGTSNPAILAGTTGLVKDGTGLLNFDARAGANTYTGGTTILAGSISTNREQALGAIPAATDYNNIIMKAGTTFTYFTNVAPSANRGIRLDGTATFAASSSGTLTWAAPITGTGGLNISMSGVALRPGSNMFTYSGDTILKSGSLSLGSDNPLPYAGNPNNGVGGTTGAGTGNVYLWSGTSIGMGSVNMRINGLYDGTGTGNGAGSIALTGTSSSKTLTLGDNNANGSFSGNITGAKLSIFKMGAGTQILSGANSFGSTTSNATTVSAGTLNVNGSIGSLTANSGGTFSPIGSILSSTALNVLGKLNFQAGSTDVFDLNSATAYDQINVSVGSVAGTVALAGALTVNLGYTPATTDTFWIINNDLTDAVTGTFAGLAEGSTVFTSGGTPWAIYYDADYSTLNTTPGSGNDVVIAAVPEPAVLTLLFTTLAAIGGLTIVRKHRSN